MTATYVAVTAGAVLLTELVIFGMAALTPQAPLTPVQVQGLAEAVHFAGKAGLDRGLVYEAISKGAAQSWQMDNRWKTMGEGRFDFGFAVDWMRKDLGLVLDEARSNGARAEVTALVDQFYAEVQSMGGRRWDTSSLAARLMRAESAR